MSDYVYSDPNKVGIITAITIMILIIALIVIIVFFLYLGVINVENVAEFGLLAGYSGDIIYLCGSNSSEACVFPINNLSDAVNICKKYLNVCQAFAVENNGKYVKFVSPSILTIDNTTNTYIYQNKIDTKIVN